MADIDINQLLASTLAAVTCASIIGGFFTRYAKSIGREEITAGIAEFEKNRFDPVIKRLDEKVVEIASVSGRLSAVETTLASLESTVKDQAHQHRQDLTGLGTRLTEDRKEQTDLLVKLIEASK